MKITKSFSVIKWLMFVPFSIIVLFSFFKIKAHRLQEKRAAVNHHIGTRFPSLPLLDINGNAAQLDLSRSPITVIDFWYRNCPGCLAEMQTFRQLLNGKENKISVISISIDEYPIWKSTVKGDDERFSFLSAKLFNWHHLLMKAGDAEEARAANSNLLFANLGITGYPAVVVLDNKGVIKEVPSSATDYLQATLKGEGSFYIFLTSKITWNSSNMILLIFGTLLLYTFILYVIKRCYRSNN